MKVIKAALGLLLFLLAGGAFFWKADHVIVQSEKKHERGPFRTEIDHVEIREHRFRPILAINFTARSPGRTRSMSLRLGATNVRKVNEIEWFGNNAVLVTLESSYGSVGNYESNHIFYDFEGGFLATTLEGSLTWDQFSRIVSEWKIQHGK